MTTAGTITLLAALACVALYFLVVGIGRLIDIYADRIIARFMAGDPTDDAGA